MEKVKEVLKYVFGILATILGLLIVKRMGDSDQIEHAEIKAEAKAEVIDQKNAEIDQKIADKKKEIQQVKESTPKDLPEQEVKDFWKNNIK